MSEPTDLGRLPDDVAARLLAQQAIRTETASWSVEAIKARLKEAARGIERLPIQIGPSSKSGFWPTPSVEFADLVNMMSVQELEAYYRAKNRAPRGGLSDREISRVEEAIHWPMHYLGSHDNERLVLKIWVWCIAVDAPFSRFHHIAVSCRRTAYNRLDKAYLVILDGLLRDRIEP